MNVHACNYASRYRVALCRRLVENGEQYCWQHRKGSSAPISYAETVAACEQYNAEQRAKRI